MFTIKFPRKKNYKRKLVVKQSSFNALCIFDKTNGMKKNFLVNTVSLYLSKPYKILISYSNSSFKFLEQGYMLSKPLKSFFLFIEK